MTMNEICYHDSDVHELTFFLTTPPPPRNSHNHILRKVTIDPVIHMFIRSEVSTKPRWDVHLHVYTHKHDTSKDDTNYKILTFEKKKRFH